MADHTQTRSGHHVPAGLRALDSQLDDLLSAPKLGLDAAGAREALIRVSALGARLAALELELAAHGKTIQVEDASGATSAGVWWAVATRQTKPSAAGKVRLATTLEDRWALVRSGLRAGEVLLEQARVIVRSLEDLPDDLDPEIITLAEKTLVAEAAHHDANDLHKLGQRILTVVAPEIGEEHDRKRLEEAEKQAAMRRRLTMVRDGHGSVRGSFTLPELQGTMLEKALNAIAAPGHQHATADTGSEQRAQRGSRNPHPKPSAQKMGEAFAELIETLNPKRLPQAGRINASIVVTLDLQALLSGIGTATLDTGGVITAAEARRLACEAMIIPMVLGGDSEIVNLGRGARFFVKRQRIWLNHRDGGCTAQGCDWPPGMCHAHHDTPWALGGRTDIANGRLLCPKHHARIHDPAFEARIGADNQVTFHRRT